MIAVTVSLPPSTNNLYFNRTSGGRGKSTAYLKWIKANEWLVAFAAQGKRINGPFRLVIEVGKPDKRRRDITNLIKPLEDLLKRAGAIQDDSDNQATEIRWSERFDNCFMQVIPTTFVPVRGSSAEPSLPSQQAAE